MTPLAHETEAYLQTILPGLVGMVRPAPTERVANLPYYLGQLKLYTVQVAEREVALVLGPFDGKRGDTKKMLASLSKYLNLPVIYVLKGLQSFERKQLIASGIQFLVPGNQLFAPSLGMDLREYFRPGATATEGQLSPSAQAILIWLLLIGYEEPWVAAEVAARLGYTAMTATRAVRELEAAELIEQTRLGRRKCIHLIDAPRPTWERAKPLMRNPELRVEFVGRRRFAHGQHGIRVAGLDALATRTMLATPNTHAWAVEQAEWAKIQRGMPAADPWDTAEVIQIWAYPPTILPDQTTVDPLSLIVSLRDNDDERVQLAIEELEKTLWQ
ncbi:ArsR family transcriptional regulator [Dyella solisilvae]|uniref:ArsR family transcriptional regulator n=1 Tax=Dyella solisilvae TaxID=1920168 RepID=A0A370K8H3_9GAMM|nr:helix-turn-helix transcriptional regulator [Dyella solisilvae]RDI98934.1 ArsR family transcriptional regulator [Dyella solisilvae]